MRRLILALIVVVGWLSSVQDVEASRWLRRWRLRAAYPNVYRQYNDRQDKIYYDSGLAFEHDSAPTT